MEKQKPFTLFVPPRLSSSQVSAVKPQTAGGDANYFKVSLQGRLGDGLGPGSGGKGWRPSPETRGPSLESSIPRMHAVKGEKRDFHTIGTCAESAETHERDANQKSMPCTLYVTLISDIP